MRQLTAAATLLYALTLSASTSAQTPTQAAPPPGRPAPAPASGAAAPSPDQQVAELEATCAKNAPERASRHAQSPLYERLGREPGIQALTAKVVSLHQQNPAIRAHFENVDPDAVAKRVAAFIVSGTGGPQVYQGPDLTTSHRAMKLTNRDFVSAGGDVVQAMKTLRYGQPEIDEVVCTLVGLRPLVVLSR